MWKQLLSGTALAVCLGVGTMADTIDPTFQQSALFGINRDNGELKRFNFPNYTLQTVGTVRDKAGQSMLGIEASGYIPGHNNLMAFWKSPADGKTHLVYINTQTALGTPVGSHLGTGMINGAVAGPNGTSLMGGTVNLNPNSSNNFEFKMMTGSASGSNGEINHVTYSEVYLTQNAQCDENGTLYEGPCTWVRFKPKGNGNQNSLVVDDGAMTLSNGSVYVLTGEMNVRLWNDHIQNGSAMGHWWLDVTGKANIHEDGNMKYGGSTGTSQWALYAVQKVEPAAGTSDTIDFNIANGKVTPTESFAAKFSVLGAAVSYGGAYDMPVTVTLNTGSTANTPFGDYNQAVSGNVNDGNNPRSYVHPNQLNAGTDLSVKAMVWKKKKSNYSGSNNNHWEVYSEYDSGTGTSHVMVLRNGDDVPEIEGFMDQNAIEDFIRDYIDPNTDKVTLDVNQAIYLFEFGSTSGSAADFQDLVVLVTLAGDVDDFNDDNAPEGAQNRLIKVNHKTGGYSMLMQLQNEYDGLASLDGLKFYATKGNQLYVVDVVAQTETLVGTMTSDNMKGLECVGSTLMGFEIVGDKLVPLSMSTGGALGTPASLGMTDLGTITFMPVDKDPAIKAVSYD